MILNKFLITGADGFVGKYMVNHLADKSSQIIKLPKKIDIRDKNKLISFCSGYSFDAVIHLAAMSFVPQSILNPKETHDINYKGTENILEALKLSSFKGVFLFIGSSDVYGIIPESSLPITEDMSLSPVNPYSKSKVRAEDLCKKWSQKEKNMRIIMTRSFNHIGPAQDERFVVSRFCKLAAMINCRFKEPHIETGNLNITRDFTDVRDIVHAYDLLLKYGQNGEVYNVCSGNEIILVDLISRLKQISGVDFQISTSSDLYREADQKRVYGSFKKLNEITGWKPSILFYDSVYDIYNYWKNKIKMEFK
jgi:GDP-4-dehydro-6-deoxy-D-mannose reductase